MQFCHYKKGRPQPGFSQVADGLFFVLRFKRLEPHSQSTMRYEIQTLPGLIPPGILLLVVFGVDQFNDIFGKVFDFNVVADIENSFLFGNTGIPVIFGVFTDHFFNLLE